MKCLTLDFLVVDWVWNLINISLLPMLCLLPWCYLPSLGFWSPLTLQWTFSHFLSYIVFSLPQTKLQKDFKRQSFFFSQCFHKFCIRNGSGCCFPALTSSIWQRQYVYFRAHWSKSQMPWTPVPRGSWGGKWGEMTIYFKCTRPFAMYYLIHFSQNSFEAGILFSSLCR